jgi:hypothetical protein
MKRLAIVMALLLSLPSFAAQKRRSVGMPDLESGAAVTFSFRGTVTDAATGLPIAFAAITTGRGSRVFTSRLGTFSITNVTLPGNGDVTAGRTGYQSSTIRISGPGMHEVNFRLQSRPTATLRKIDGTTLALDDDSVKFGYVVPFMNYQTATGNDFCMTDGTQAEIPMSQIMRITTFGISVATSSTSCCQGPAPRVLLELRDQTIHDATFIDSCYGYAVDLIGRDHVTGDPVFVPFGEVLEIVFP